MNSTLKIGLVLVLGISLVLLVSAIQPNILGVPNSTSTTDINDSTSGSNLLVSGAASQNIYVTHYHVIADGTVNVSFISGTGTNCATGQVTLDGPYQLGLGTNGFTPGIAIGTGFGAVLVVPAGKDLCLNTDASIHVGGAITTGGPF
jgi:hypothetical protein